MNAPSSYGVGALPVNNINGVRWNTSLAYLDPIVVRPNLTIEGKTLVRKVAFSGHRAVGIEVEREGRPLRIEGDEVILSAGAVKTPHLLMLSGVGPEDQLRAGASPSWSTSRRWARTSPTTARWGSGSG